MKYSLKLSELPITKNNITFLGVLSLILKTTWKYFRIHFIGVLFLGVISGFFQLITPKIFQRIIDALVGGETNLNFFILLGTLAATALLLGALFKVFAEKLSFYIATQVEDRWRYTSLLKFYQLPLKWLDQHDSGEIGAKIDRGGGAIWTIIYDIFGQNLIVSFITLVLLLVYVIISFPLFSILFLIPIPIYILITYFISRRIAAMQAELSELDHAASRTFFDGVGNVRYVKTFGKEYAETTQYARKWDKYHKLEYRMQRRWVWQGFLQKLIEAVMRAVLLLAGVIAIQKNALTLGEVVLLVSFQQVSFTPLEQLGQLFTRLRRVTKRASHLFTIAAEQDQLADLPRAKEVSDLKKEITFNRVTFAYSKKLAALRDVSFTLKSGTTTAIVGRSGAGKSTIAMLLLRFYDPDQGRIMWDGQDLRAIQRPSLRKHSTLILQDTTLFNRTIAENIKYGRPEASEQEMIKAAQLAHAHAFILKLPKSYNSIVGERGVRLSGGQRQRIAIARALLTKSSLIVMDEATSHLDSETEKAIKEATQYYQGKQTQVIIAHRLSTVQHADNIILLDKGQILAQGKHTELLKHSLYQKLCALQLK